MKARRREGVGTYHDLRITLDMQPCRMPLSLGIGADLRQQGAQIRGHRLFAGIAARKGEITLQHPAHLVDIALHIAHVIARFEQGEGELEAGQDGAQIVADAVEQGGCAARWRARCAVSSR